MKLKPQTGNERKPLIKWGSTVCWTIQIVILREDLFHFLFLSCEILKKSLMLKL
jgi:hypothetical protein